MGLLCLNVGRVLFTGSLTFTHNDRTLLFLVFFTTPAPEHHEPGSPAPPSWRDALSVVIVCAATFVATSVVSVVFLLWYPERLGALATALGVFAAVLACIQYIPQIWTTWKLQHVMSLSIPMMLIQTPGSFVFATSLAIRLGSAGWSAWGVYIVTGCLQGCLLFMAIKFELRDRKKSRLATEQATESHLGEQDRPPSSSNEQTPLLSNGHH